MTLDIPFKLDKNYNTKINDKIAFPSLGGGLFDFLTSDKIIHFNNLLKETKIKLENKEYSNSNKKSKVHLFIIQSLFLCC